MYGWDTAPSLGGWRELTEKDYVTCALTGALSKSGGKKNKLTERLLRAHPVWPAVSFLSDASIEAVCRLVCEIFDPRWHVDPAKPDARKRYLTTFGLGQHGLKNIGFILGSEAQPMPKVELAKLVLDAWTGGNYTAPPTEEINPQRFLWRIAIKDGGGTKGLTRACQVFLNFLYDVWLDNLTPARQFSVVVRKLGKRNPSEITCLRMLKDKKYSPELFVAAHFFEDPSEVLAWKQHILRLQTQAP
jgi:hypothetical protein